MQSTSFRFIYIVVSDFSVITWQEKRRASFEYGRYGNPTTVVLEEKIRRVWFLVFGFDVFLYFLFCFSTCVLW